MDRIITACTLFTVAALLAMGVDNTAQLERCQQSGRGQETCRLLVLGR